MDKLVFGLIFDMGEVAKLTPEDKMAYEASLKHKRDADNTYSTDQRIFDHDESELLGMDNIFAYIVLACQKALDEDKVPEQELAEQRSTIARRLIETNKYSKDRIMSFLVFLKSFLFIRDKEINSNFDQYIYQVTGGTIEMGVIETIKRQEREKGIHTGKAKGFAEGERKKALEKALEFKKVGLPIADIAKATVLTIHEIEKL